MPAMCGRETCRAYNRSSGFPVLFKKFNLFLPVFTSPSVGCALFLHSFVSHSTQSCDNTVSFVSGHILDISSHFKSTGHPLDTRNIFLSKCFCICRLCGQNLVQFCVFRKMVFKWHDCFCCINKSLTATGMRKEFLLFRADMKQF